MFRAACPESRFASNARKSDWAALVDQLLKLPIAYAAKLGLLAAAAMAGESLPPNILIAGVQELLEAAKTESWRLERNHGELMGWIELFAFCDRPKAVFDALDLIPVRHREPWELDRLLSAFSQSPQPDALAALEELARRDPRFLERYEWTNALITTGTETAAMAVLGHVCHGAVAARDRGFDAWRMADQLAAFARTFPTVKTEMVRRYEDLAPGAAKSILEAALAEIPDRHIILLMIAAHAASAQSHRAALRKAVRNLAVGQRPISDWPGAFQEFSVSLNELRKDLFDLTGTDSPSSLTAEGCLTRRRRRREVERLR